MKYLKAIYRVLRKVEYMDYWFCSLFYYTTSMWKDIDIMSAEATIDYIICNKCSVARFGDGEFEIIRGGQTGFQEKNSYLAARLLEVLHSSAKECLVCIPIPLLDDKHLNYNARKFWRKYLFSNRTFFEREIEKYKVFGNTNFTRFYIDLKDRLEVTAYTNKLKQIWNGRHILIVEGYASRLGIGNDLFANVASIKRITCPSTNAFSKYDEILEAVYDIAEKDMLIICALGMTATVLAYDLSQSGYQALDLGHVDIEYCWFKMNAKEKCRIPFKAVNEVGQNNIDEDFHDEEYLKSIVYKIRL